MKNQDELPGLKTGNMHQENVPNVQILERLEVLRAAGFIVTRMDMNHGQGFRTIHYWHKSLEGPRKLPTLAELDNMSK